MEKNLALQHLLDRNPTKDLVGTILPNDFNTLIPHVHIFPQNKTIFMICNVISFYFGMKQRQNRFFTYETLVHLEFKNVYYLKKFGYIITGIS
jgi:glyoxylate carboligase